jgi:GT2 family glycosyltransferase
LKTSVIIATHARPDSLPRLVASLAPQLVSGRRELIIAENGTPVPMRLALEAAPLKHLHEPRPGKCRIQNRAIKEASGEILVFLDDDLVVAPGYLEAVEQFFDAHREFAAMKGRILPAEDPEKKVGPMAVYLDLPIVDHGDEMSQRLRRAGFRIGYAPKALVYHEVDPARASRERFIRIARERGRCRMLHEKHSAADVILKNAIAQVRLRIAQVTGAGLPRIAREERRLGVARGMFDGLGG